MQSMSQDGSGNNAQHRIAALLVKRSKARGTLGLWNDALKDADETIKMTPSSPWGYERRHAALRALQRYDEAIDAYSHMHSLIEASLDEEIRQLAKKYIAPSLLVTSIDDIVRKVSMTSPLVLIDVESGRLCDAAERLDTFKSQSQFKELLSSMMEDLNVQRIQQVVDEYFRYVTLSHVWQGKEASYQDVMATGSVWELDSSFLNDKLRKFCQVVRSNGFRWAWCDTCCIDKTIYAVLNQSLIMMYRWYEASAATFVFLADIRAPSTPNLKDSRWLTRSWTLLELLASKVIRFYTHDWQPYLGDTRFNHKESPEIVQELAYAMEVTPNTITAFDPDGLDIQEKLRLASTRNATVEEDVAYSLIGIFKSDNQPRYGEGDAALGRLLEEIVARSGNVTVLDWTGKSSSYNSCLPTTLAVYSQTPFSPFIHPIDAQMDTHHSGDVTVPDWGASKPSSYNSCLPTTLSQSLATSPIIPPIDAQMDTCIASFRASLSQEDIMVIYNQVARLPPARFANRRLHLPCIIFPVQNVTTWTRPRSPYSRYDPFPMPPGTAEATSPRLDYRAEVSVIGQLDFQTSDRLSIVEPSRLIFVRPWTRELCGPLNDSAWGNTANDNSDDYTRALQLLACLQQPFRVLLLQQHATGYFKRVAAEEGIFVRGTSSKLARNFHTDVVEIL